MSTEQNDPKELTDEEWRERLDPKAYEVLRQAGTERPFTGELLDNTESGIYKCKGCNSELFVSDTKYKSGCGWPSFYDGLEKNIEKRSDRSHGMIRTEVVCKECKGHLGHIFNDGPEPTGLRYCINSAALEFERKELSLD